MAVAPIGVLDLSVVTNTLISRLNTYVSTTSPLLQTFDTDNPEPLPLPVAPPPSITCSGAMPDAVRKEAGCQLTFSLFHVTEDKYQRNSALLNPWAQANPGLVPRAQLIPYQPMSLDLYYLLTAWADQQYQQEQQAMSMAMQFFYQTPIVRTQVTLPGIAGAIPEEFTLTMEIETSDELARLWQAITVPMRLSVIYKVGVVLLTPPAALAQAPPVQDIALFADPASFPLAAGGQVFGTTRTVSLAALTSSVGNPVILSRDYSPAVAVSGLNQHFALQGANLNQATSNNVYLLMPDGTEFNVSNWMVAEPPATVPPSPPSYQTASKITLQLPTTLGALPGNAPPPGVYQLRAGSDAPTTNRTNATPFSVGAWIDTSLVPSPNPPLLPSAGGTYTVAGQNFVSGATEVLLDTFVLSAANFNVVSAQEITFTIPSTVPAGTYTLRVRVNNVESPPAWWVVVA